jgi:hypothetical protein
MNTTYYPSRAGQHQFSSRGAVETGFVGSTQTSPDWAERAPAEFSFTRGSIG